MDVWTLNPYPIWKLPVNYCDLRESPFYLDAGKRTTVRSSGIRWAQTQWCLSSTRELINSSSYLLCAAGCIVCMGAYQDNTVTGAFCRSMGIVVRFIFHTSNHVSPREVYTTVSLILVLCHCIVLESTLVLSMFYFITHWKWIEQGKMPQCSFISNLQHTCTHIHTIYY